MPRRHYSRARRIALVGLVLVLSVSIGLPGSPVAQAHPATPIPTAPPLGCTGNLISPVLQILLVVGPETEPTVATTLQQVNAVVTRRAETLAGEGCRVWTDGVNQILVQFAGPDTPAADVATQALTGTGLLEIVDTQEEVLAAGTVVATSLGGPDNATPAPGPVYETIVGGADIADAFVTQEPTTGQDVVGFELTPDAATRFCEFTTNNVAQPAAIVVDKEVVSTPIINAPICGGQGIVAGLTAEETQALVVQLLAGALPAPVAVVAIEAIDCSESPVTPAA